MSCDARRIPDLVYGTDIKSNYQSQRLRLPKQFTHTSDGEGTEPDAPDVRQPRLDFAPTP